MIRRELLDPERVPFHEAGHAVVAHYHRYQVVRATVHPNYFPDDPDDLYVGQVDHFPPWPSDDETTYAVWQIRARTMAEVALAGRAAEREKFGEEFPDDNGDSSDLAGVIYLLQELYSPKTEAGTQAYIHRAEMKARDILRQNWSVVTHLSGQLQTHRTLEKDHLQQILKNMQRRAERNSDKRWAKKYDPVFGEYYDLAD